jgi:hypothetical protein
MCWGISDQYLIDYHQERVNGLTQKRVSVINKELLGRTTFNCCEESFPPKRNLMPYNTGYMGGGGTIKSLG